MRRNPTAANPYPIDIYDPVYGGTPPVLLPFINNAETRRVATLYVQDMWSVSDRLTISGGVRLDSYRQKIENLLANRTGKAVGKPLNFRIGGRYEISDVFAVHANWGESYLLNSGTGRTGDGFAPEQGHGYELGVTAAWPGIDLAVTWFNIEKQNILTTDPVDPSYLAPVGNLRSRGLEFDAAIKLARRWQLVANYAWTPARADDVAFATDAVLNVPDHSATIFALGRFLDDRGRGLTLSFGASYVGDRAGALDTSGLVLPSYIKAKAAVEYVFSTALTLRLEADNLFDERYAQSSYNPVWIYPGAPRTVRASARLSF